ncbi:WD40-repeat-containing domain protein [Myxozyma melibiosi]|uniref:ASTRA-associated protein 1 n=1 Tax=Myxozyma melibiosi TaxID=54550 RepID=A0ABR1F084_9ASCO
MYLQLDPDIDPAVSQLSRRLGYSALLDDYMSSLAASATLRALSNPTTAIAFHRSNIRLVSGDDNGWCVHWSLVTRRPLAIWRSHEDTVLTVKWLSDDLLLTHGRDNKLHVFRLDDLPLSTDIPTPADSENSGKWRKPWLVASIDVNALNFCSAATLGTNMIAVPGTLDSDTIDVYTLLPTLARPYAAISAGVKTGIVMAIALHADILIAGYESGHVAMYQLQDDGVAQLIYLCKAHSQPVLSVAVHALDATVLSSSADSKIVKHPLVRDPSFLPSSPKSSGIRNSEDENDLSTVSLSTPISTHDIKHTGIASLNLRDDGKIFATACWDGNVRIFLYSNLKLLASFRGGRQDGISCLAFGRTSLDDPEDDNSEEEKIVKEVVSDVTKVVVGNAMRMKAEKKVREKHWLAVGGKDGRVGLWEVY